MAALKIVFLEVDVARRRVLSKILANDKHMEVIGMAANFMMAYMHVKLRKPDVLLLSESNSDAKLQVFINDVRKISDVPMLLMSNKIISSIRHGSDGSHVNIHLFRISNVTLSESDGSLCQKLCQNLQSIALLTPYKAKSLVSTSAKTKPQPKAMPVVVAKQRLSRDLFHDARLQPLIAMGASTGGTEALSRVLKKLSTPSSAVVIVQHIPSAFGASFVSKLNKVSAMNVVEAHDGDVMLQGYAYIGVGSEHFFIERDGNRLMCRVEGKSRVSGHCPSVNVLFDSVAKHLGSKAVGVLLTGMGEDGATGLKKMRNARARTLVQDQKTSVVWGMPGAAVKMGAAEEQSPLNEVARRLMQLAANGMI